MNLYLMAFVNFSQSKTLSLKKIEFFYVKLEAC